MKEEVKKEQRKRTFPAKKEWREEIKAKNYKERKKMENIFYL